MDIYGEMGRGCGVGVTCKALSENSNYDWLWRQYYHRRWLFKGRGAVTKDAYIRRHLTDKGMEVIGDLSLCLVRCSIETVMWFDGAIGREGLAVRRDHHARRGYHQRCPGTDAELLH